MLIRRERPGDIPAIDAVHRAAFALEYANGTDPRPEVPDASADPPEVALVHRLRSDSGWMPTLSLVAQDHERVVGHVCLTRAGVGPFPVLALGPIGVLPERQGAGVGAALMHAALGAADALDEPLVGLLGSLEYYPRFGFVPGTRLGIVPDEPSWASHFQVRTLTAYEPGMTGGFRYCEPFYGV
ncbi:N-acetyltransferase [Nocardia sp. NEAU-G5]|uniref:N-acetyltransferase n=1 Tax=Nocardia albiluteola TaxID=2842303 RepID=A0ABS6AUP8_9NOCA|nr:N-acetyltransferase [Nocardia albiluteola]MBU3060763.1 N-acetyltransferase [Nocardia albiluteola]